MRRILSSLEGMPVSPLPVNLIRNGSLNFAADPEDFARHMRGAVIMTETGQELRILNATGYTIESILKRGMGKIFEAAMDSVPGTVSGSSYRGNAVLANVTLEGGNLVYLAQAQDWRNGTAKNIGPTAIARTMGVDAGGVKRLILEAPDSKLLRVI